MKQTKKIVEKREHKGKEAKKIKNVTINEEDQGTAFIKLIAIVTVFVLVFFGITYIMTKKANKKENEETEIQYSEILVGEIWSKGGTYYVLATHEKDPLKPIYTSYLSGQTYYLVNLDSVFNLQYVAETSNLYTTTPSEIRFKDATLLKLQDGRVIESYEGADSITNYIATLIS